MVDRPAATHRSCPHCFCGSRPLPHSCRGLRASRLGGAGAAAYGDFPPLVTLCDTSLPNEVAVRTADDIATPPMLRDNLHLLRSRCLNR